MSIWNMSTKAYPDITKMRIRWTADSREVIRIAQVFRPIGDLDPVRNIPSQTL